MPRKRKRKLRPKLPSRVKKTRTKRSARARNQHPELWGLGSVALGLFLGAVLYFGWNGGYVGGWLGDGLDRLVGDAKYVVPVALAVLGALVVTRSALVDVRPFRTGTGGARLRSPDHARQGPGRLPRPADGRRGRGRDRRHGVAPARRPPDARRLAPALGRLARRDPPPLGPRPAPRRAQGAVTDS